MNSVEDLRGKTIYASGKGATPAYALNYILTENGIDPEKDVTIEWKSEHAECLAALMAEDNAIAMLPQPFVTTAQMKSDKIKVRHILRIPRVSAEATDSMRVKLDSLATDIRANKLAFEEAATYMSDDKDTRNNHGLMSFNSEDGRTSKFQMKDLPTEVARKVENMEVGDVSDAFTMVNEKGKNVVAIVKLKNRIPAHRATINEDFQVLKNVVLQKQRAEFLHNWVVKKIKTTYVRMQDRYKNYKYEYEGWVK